MKTVSFESGIRREAEFFSSYFASGGGINDSYYLCSKGNHARDEGL
jgi:hypothetical protein